MSLQRTDVQGFSALDFTLLLLPLFVSTYVIMHGAITSRKNSKLAWYAKFKLAPWHFRPGIMNIGWTITALVQGVAAFVVLQQNGSYWHSLWVGSLAIWVAYIGLHGLYSPIFFDNRMPALGLAVRILTTVMAIICAILFYVLNSWAGGSMMVLVSFFLAFVCSQDIYLVAKNDVSSKALDRKNAFSIAVNEP
jgi:tryptophan-rich sensory protein